MDNYILYIFQVFANETRDPTLFSTAVIVINVENANDNSPVFDEIEGYYVNVTEDSKLDKYPIY